MDLDEDDLYHDIGNVFHGLHESRQSPWHPDHFTADTVKCLLHAGAIHDVTCLYPFPDQSLISVASWRTHLSHDLLVVSVLIEAGVEIREASLQNFQDAIKHIRDNSPSLGSVSGPSFHPGLKSIIQVLRDQVDKSQVYRDMYESAWEFAIAVDCNIAFDQDIIDTRILFSTEDLLREALRSAVRQQNLELLSKILEDPRTTQSGFLGPGGQSPFKTAVKHLEAARKVLPVCTVLAEASRTAKVHPDRNGLLPIHHLASLELPDGDRDMFEEFGSLIQELSRQGAGCNSCGPDGRTALHFLARLDWSSGRYITTAKAMLQFETDSNISKALKTTDDDGYTPFSYAITETDEARDERQKNDIALLFLERATELQLPGAFQSPIPILALCVQNNAEDVYSELVKAGIGNGNDNNSAANRKPALHHLTYMTSASFVRRLISEDPSALTLRIDGDIPLDAYIRSLMSRAISFYLPDKWTSIIKDLALQHELDTSEKALSMEKFAIIVEECDLERASRDLFGHEAEYVNSVNDVMKYLLEHGFMESFEAVKKRSFVLPVLERAFNEEHSQGRWDLRRIDPCSPSTICEIIRRTGSHFWKTLKDSTCILRLLKAAIRSSNQELVRMLLEKDVSVHQRCDRPHGSALEFACRVQSSRSTDKEIFSLLLNSADKARLNEIDPDDPDKRGLIHLLVRTDSMSDTSWHINELVQRGVDVNLRTGSKLHAPALCWHILSKNVDTSRELIKHGADPNLKDSDGYDAVLCATEYGMVPVLEELWSRRTSSDRNVYWETTCSPGAAVQGFYQVLDGANALHICALKGQADCLKFFLDHDILTDVDSVTSVDGYTPLHVAAIEGKLDCMSILVEKGAKVNPKARNGSLPLHLAVRNGHIAIVKFLVQHGAEADLDSYGMSPTSYSRQAKNDKITEILGRAGLDSGQHPISVHITEELITVFEKAILDENLDLCDGLLSRGCNPDMELTSKCCCGTPLMLAIAHVKPNVVQWLLDRDVRTTKHIPTRVQNFAPVDIVIRQPSYNHFLSRMLEQLYHDGGSILGHVPSLISAAVEMGNTEGLEILLREASRHREMGRLVQQGPLNIGFG